jgi:hypothetical protein
MEWETMNHEELKYLEIITKGVAHKEDSMEMANAITQSMKQHKLTRVLIDHRKITKVTGRTTDVYNRPKVFKMLGIILGIKVAEVINPAHLEHFKFLETVCINNGFQFSVFFDKSSALKWLLR